MHVAVHPTQELHVPESQLHPASWSRSQTDTALWMLEKEDASVSDPEDPHHYVYTFGVL